MLKPKNRRVAAFNFASHLGRDELQVIVSRCDREDFREVIADVVREKVARKMAKPWPGPPTTRKKERPKCGARTRAGGSCQAPAVWDKRNDKPKNGRCRLHGGLSTGPKSPEGKARSLAQLKHNKTN